LNSWFQIQLAPLKLGITSPLPAILSLALGSCETTPLEMAVAYATIASGGIYSKPHLITKVRDKNGALIYRHKGSRRLAAQAGATAALHGMLRAAVTRGRAVQVELVKLMLKAPGTKRLKLACDDPLSNFAFKCNLRRYSAARGRTRRRGGRRLRRRGRPGRATTTATRGSPGTPRAWRAWCGAGGITTPACPARGPPSRRRCGQGLTLVHFSAQLEHFVWDRGCA
jgi:hypothetical protein